MKLILLLTFSFLFLNLNADRLIEVEDYYHKKVTKLIKLRYPNSAFSVFVNVSNGENKKQSSSDTSTLPYFEAVGDEKDFWSRKDLALGTLIAYLDSVSIRIEIDRKISDKDKTAFREYLFKELKLSSNSDNIDIIKSSWTNQKPLSSWKSNFWLYFALICFISFFALLYLLSRLSIKALIKGLADPLSEIGKTTQNLAENTLGMAPSSLSSSQQDSGPHSELSPTSGSLQTSSLAEERQIIKEILKQNRHLFDSLDAETMNFIEKEGLRNPQAMGSLLLELDYTTLKTAFTYGYGKWWYKALSSPGPLNSESLQIINKLRKLTVRREFSGKSLLLENELENVDLLLNRTDIKVIGKAVKELSFRESFPLLNLLPKEKMMTICKYIYPGEWGQALNPESRKIKLDIKKAIKIKDKIEKASPLRDLDEVSLFFEHMDYYQYLNLASTKDEREFYRTLPENSILKHNRIPLFQFFEQEDNLIKEVSLNTDLRKLALVLKHCDTEERNKVMSHMTERQQYLLRELLKNTHLSEIDDDTIIQNKDQFLNHFYTHLKNKKIEQNHEQDSEANAA